MRANRNTTWERKIKRMSKVIFYITCILHVIFSLQAILVYRHMIKIEKEAFAGSWLRIYAVKDRENKSKLGSKIAA